MPHPTITPFREKTYAAVPKKPTKITFVFDDLPNYGLIRPKDLFTHRIVPFTQSTLWRKIREGNFPAPVHVSDAISAFRVSDIREWLADPAGYRAGANK